MNDRQKATREGVAEAWDYWISQHPVTVGDLIEDSIKKAVKEWLDLNGPDLKGAVTEWLDTHGHDILKATDEGDQ